MALKRNIKKILRNLYTLGATPSVGIKYNKNSCYPPAHFYSPIVDLEELKKREGEIWSNNREEIAGVNLRSTEQINFVKQLSVYYKDIPFTFEKKEGLRYYFNNLFYSYTDAIVLYSIIRNQKPKQIIEVGSGFSSAVMLDTNELFFNKEIQLTFIEPYTERLNMLISNADKANTEVIEKFVQGVPLEKFQTLNAGDILFIDSTHVAKTGSDVNYLFFKVLPALNPGVLIHFHDIFYPFEYPKSWVMEGRNWNENYFLKAFLMYNDEFDILLFSDYIHKLHSEAFDQMPLTKKNTGGSIWIRKK